MILDSTYHEKEHKEILEKLVGKPFSILDSIRMNGVGSKRMIIESTSPNLNKYLNKVSDINYANIEMRKKGIIVYINKGLKNFTWAIPYHLLAIFKTNGFSIHSKGSFIHFKNNMTFKENRRFFEKMNSQKLEYDEQYNFHNE